MRACTSAFPKRSLTEQFQLDRFNEIKLSANGQLETYTNAFEPSTPGYAAYLQQIGARTITYDDGQNTQNESINYLDGFDPDDDSTGPSATFPGVRFAEAKETTLIASVSGAAPEETDDSNNTGNGTIDVTEHELTPANVLFPSLAGYGAQVLRIDPPSWDEPAVVPEVALGKRCARLDLRAERPELRVSLGDGPSSLPA